MSTLKNFIGTLRDYFLIGKSGIRIKNSSGVAQVRTADDSDFTRAQADYPTTTDDLTTKEYVDDTNVVFSSCTELGPISSAIYTTIEGFPFPGTNKVLPTTAYAALNKLGAAGTAFFRIYDVTNTQVIVEISKTANGIELVSGALANLPATPAIFAIQLRTTGASIVCGGFSLNGN